MARPPLPRPSNPSTSNPHPDPFDTVLLPPASETPTQRAARLQAEEDAKKISDEIDEQLKAERNARNGVRARRAVRVLMLGQSESGKSTTVKNFQLRFAPHTFRASDDSERAFFWRAVVQLNLVRSVVVILDLLGAEIARAERVGKTKRDGRDGRDERAERASLGSRKGKERERERDREREPSIYSRDEDAFGEDGDGDGEDEVDGMDGMDDAQSLHSLRASASLSLSLSPPLPNHNHNHTSIPHFRPSTSSSSSASPPTLSPPNNTTNTNENRAPFKFTQEHKSLHLRLSPLRGVLRDLEKRLGAGSQDPVSVDIEGGSGGDAAPFNSNSGNNIGREGVTVHTFSNIKRKPQEFSVRSGTGWKGVLERMRSSLPYSSNGSNGSSSSLNGSGSANGARDAFRERQEAEAEKTGRIIGECAGDMRQLWGDRTVRALLGARDVRLEERGGFFLDDIDRIAQPSYIPSDDDVIRARLRTIGVQEYRFNVENGRSRNGLQQGNEWILYDVGGTRTLRHAWSAFFDDVNAIIFLAPISAIDEKLAEDRRVNRLEDTLLLWRAVCSNKLLARVQLVLFLNKCDLLEKKIRYGLQVKDYIPSYSGSGRENNINAVGKYFKLKFREMQRQYSPEPRPFYCYLTSVIDTKATSYTLQAVQEGILREHLRESIV